MGCGCAKNRSSNLQSKSNNCSKTLNTLRSLHVRIINLLNKNNEEILQQTELQLKNWIRNISSYCPSENELEIVSSFIASKETENM